MTDEIDDVEPEAPEDEIEVEEEESSEKKVADSDLDALRAEIEAQKKAAAEERSRREAAEREAEEGRKKVKEAVDARFASDEIAISNALVAAQSDADRYRKDLAAAWEAGNYAEAADLQTKLNRADGAVMALEGRKSQLAAYKEQMATQAEQAQRAPRVDNSRTEQWLRDHPDVRSDPRKWAKAQAAHLDAVADGIAPNTDAYFEFVETRLGMREAVEVDDADEPPAPKRSAAASAVPPSRSGGSGGTRRAAERVTLTASEKEIAEGMFNKMPPAEAYKLYAKNKRDLLREGKIH